MNAKYFIIRNEDGTYTVERATMERASREGIHIVWKRSRNWMKSVGTVPIPTIEDSFDVPIVDGVFYPGLVGKIKRMKSDIGLYSFTATEAGAVLTRLLKDAEQNDKAISSRI